MTRRAASFTQGDVTRAVKAVQAAGLDVSVVEVRPDGTINVKVGASQVEQQVADSPFDQWKAKSHARSNERN